MSLRETTQAYSTLFMDLSPEFKVSKPLRTIELFAGYGSQSLALDYLGVEHESIGISEWAWKSILAYKAIHCPDDRNDYSGKLSDGEVFGFLAEAGISTDYNSPLDHSQVKRLGVRKCRDIYNAVFATKDHPDVSRAKGSDFVIAGRENVQVLLTYSFPCQDLSNAGKLAGMDEGSGTRSSLLWQVRRILSELKELNQLPDVLLMENVPGVVGSKNIANFNKWAGFLESLGYSSKVQIMEATDFGIPQTRKRCFMISVLGDYSFQFPKPIPLTSCLLDYLEDSVDEKYFLTEKQLSQVAKWESEKNSSIFDKGDGIPIRDNTKMGFKIAHVGDGVYTNHLKGKRGTVQKDKVQTLESSPDIGLVVKRIIRVGSYSKVGIGGHVINPIGLCETLMENHGDVTAVLSKPICLNPKVDGKQPKIENRVYDPKGTATALTVSFPVEYKVGEAVRRLTPREYFRLMGVADPDSDKLGGFADSSLYHFAGDSIVTTCLMAIFAQFYEGLDWLAKARERGIVKDGR